MEIKLVGLTDDQQKGEKVGLRRTAFDLAQRPT
jgi:hypothetical protein